MNNFGKAASFFQAKAPLVRESLRQMVAPSNNPPQPSNTQQGLKSEQPVGTTSAPPKVLIEPPEPHRVRATMEERVAHLNEALTVRIFARTHARARLFSSR